jgi:hypothetical protein
VGRRRLRRARRRRCGRPHLQRRRRAGRNAVDVDARLRAPRRSHADARLRRDARGCDGGVRQELAEGIDDRAGAEYGRWTAGAGKGAAMTSEAKAAADYVLTEAPRLIRVAGATAISFALYDGANRALRVADQKDVHIVVTRSL